MKIVSSYLKKNFIMLSPNINSLKSIEALEDELKDFLSDPETTHNYEKSVTLAQTILKHKRTKQSIFELNLDPRT